MSGDVRRTLSEELAELERTNPEVKRAADDYDLTVRRILRRVTLRDSAPPRDEDRDSPKSVHNGGT